MSKQLSNALTIASLVVVVASFLLLWVVVRAHRKVNKTRELVLGAEEEISQALQKINSTNHDRILSGLQTLAVLRDRDAQIKALPRLTELVNDEDAIVSTQAKATIEKIALTGSDNASRPHSAPKQEMSV